MTQRKHVDDELEAYCADVGPEDGLDPRLAPKRSHGRRGSGRKTLQLCKQIQEALSLEFADTPDGVLEQVVVARVEPLDTSRLLVVLEPGDDDDELDAATVLAAVERAAAHLRSVVAAAICRKRTPDLSFRFEPRGEGELV